MKKRITTIFTFTVAAVLISSIAYAAKKKLRTAKSEPLTPDVTEVDLAAELLDIKLDHRHKSPKTAATDKQELKDLAIARLSNK